MGPQVQHTRPKHPPQPSSTRGKARPGIRARAPVTYSRHRPAPTFMVGPKLVTLNFFRDHRRRISFYCLLPILFIPINVTHIYKHFSTFVALRAISLLNPIHLFPNYACPQNLIRSLVMDENWGIHTSGVSQYVCKVSTITYGRNTFF